MEVVIVYVNSGLKVVFKAVEKNGIKDEQESHVILFLETVLEIFLLYYVLINKITDTTKVPYFSKIYRR